MSRLLRLLSSQPDLPLLWVSARKTLLSTEVRRGVHVLSSHRYGTELCFHLCVLVLTELARRLKWLRL